MKAWKIDAKARSSMADDLAAGRRTEVDFINGELVRLAEKLGVGAPINRNIVELIRKAEGGAPPWQPAALRREVLEA
jgi:2-dehydropantoate 2-reductase